jgi:hypothetical protein
VTISGPATAFVGQASPFGASVLPPDATLPIIYTRSPEPDSGQGTSHVEFTWAICGAVMLTLTAENCGALVTDTRRVDVQLYQVYLPIVLRGW